ncbi:hypothetical protein H310_04180 [Aphanomyces invadans]|uniref:Uncharacterized protein n=1 Tax=Aphanomyces invadans TaxID=157072 RepID=A0A024UG52_9STRA|nr:hypothetical protein H310_04180 [Aphanomyces invadans]ETW05185.1 hypothetical protein H310_04180 [Aphanomyces invadans]|eukprot:XP_008866623.1 hypothetical protein H310_04180 [Aphanomyces invadans]
MTRLAYTTLFFVNAIVAMALRAFGDRFLKYLWSFDTCTDEAANPHCVGNQAVYRASFAMSCFFVLMALVSALSERGFNNCCCLWCFQLPLYGVMFVGSFTIPNDFFYGFAWVARVASVGFLVLQVIIIIDTTYNVRDYLLDKIDASHADERVSLLSFDERSTLSCSRYRSWFWKALFFGLVLGALGGSLVGVGFLYHYYDICQIGHVFTTVTLVASAVVTGLSVTSEGPGLLPPAILSLYTVFLCYEALRANPDAQCNPFLAYQASSTVNTVIAALIGAATITWTSWSTASSLIRLDTLSDENLEGAPKDKQSDVPSWQFHAVMVVGSLYMAMVVTQWGTATGQQDGAAMWVHIASQWVASALFVWTLVAPYLFPDREFS